MKFNRIPLKSGEFNAAIEETLKGFIEAVNESLKNQSIRLEFNGYEFGKTIKVSKHNPTGEAIFPTTLFLTKHSETVDKLSVEIEIQASKSGKNVHFTVTAPIVWDRPPA